MEHMGNGNIVLMSVIVALKFEIVSILLVAVFLLAAL